MRSIIVALVLGVLLRTTVESANNPGPNPKPAERHSMTQLPLPFGTEPVPLEILPSLFPPPVIQHVSAIEAIRNTTSLYPLAINGKNFDALDYVFAQDAVANYSTPIYVVSGLEAIKATLIQTLARVITQHSLRTQAIRVVSPSLTYSVTYYTVSHFGTGNYTGQLLTAYAQYQDNWQRQEDETWRTKYRSVVYMGPYIGNLNIFS